MSKRILVVVAVTALVVTESSASGPFDWLRPTRRTVPSSRTVKPLLPNILRSPEKLTELYGPSILIREPVAKTKKSKFVTQPD